MQLYLIRHTAVALPPGICYGQTDIALAASWREDFARLEAKLPAAARRPARAFSSPLQRCLRLAEFIYPRVDTDPRLLEFDFGRWEGRAWSELPEAELRAWGADYDRVPAPGGETFATLRRRAVAFIDELSEALRRQQPTATAVVITHSGVITALLAHWLAIPPQQAFRLRVDYGGVSAVTLREEWIQVDYVNR